MSELCSFENNAVIQVKESKKWTMQQMQERARAAARPGKSDVPCNHPTGWGAPAATGALPRAAEGNDLGAKTGGVPAPRAPLLHPATPPPLCWALMICYFGGITTGVGRGKRERCGFDLGPKYRQISNGHNSSPLALDKRNCLLYLFILQN